MFVVMIFCIEQTFRLGHCGIDFEPIPAYFVSLDFVNVEILWESLDEGGPARVP